MGHQLSELVNNSFSVQDAPIGCDRWRLERRRQETREQGVSACNRPTRNRPDLSTDANVSKLRFIRDRTLRPCIHPRTDFRTPGLPALSRYDSGRGRCQAGALEPANRRLTGVGRWTGGDPPVSQQSARPPESIQWMTGSPCRSHVTHEDRPPAVSGGGRIGVPSLPAPRAAALSRRHSLASWT